MSSTTSRPPRPRFARPGSRCRWLLASLTAFSALAGCGGSSAPALDGADAQRLIALSNRVAALHDPCGQQRAIERLRVAATQVLQSGRVPTDLQETLSSGVNALVADQPTCLPNVTTTTEQPPLTTAPPPAPASSGRHAPKPEPKPKPHGHGPGHGPGHGHGGGHGHGHGHGK